MTLLSNEDLAAFADTSTHPYQDIASSDSVRSLGGHLVLLPDVDDTSDTSMQYHETFLQVVSQTIEMDLQARRGRLTRLRQALDSPLRQLLDSPVEELLPDPDPQYVSPEWFARLRQYASGEEDESLESWYESELD